MWYENRGGDLQGCLFPDTTLILAAFIFIWLHCLTSRSPGSPQKAGSGAPVIPDVADTDMWNNMDGEDPSSHSYSSPHVTAAVCHFLLMCSDYETTHVVSMISVCVCVCCSVWKKCRVYASMHVFLCHSIDDSLKPHICPGTQETATQFVCDIMCFYRPLGCVCAQPDEDERSAFCLPCASS